MKSGRKSWGVPRGLSHRVYIGRIPWRQKVTMASSRVMWSRVIALDILTFAFRQRGSMGELISQRRRRMDGAQQVERLGALSHARSIRGQRVERRLERRSDRARGVMPARGPRRGPTPAGVWGVPPGVGAGFTLR